MQRAVGGMGGAPDASPVGVIAAARRGEVVDDGGGAEGTIDVVLAGTEQRRPVLSPRAGPAVAGLA